MGMREVDLTRCIWGGICGMNCSQRLGEFVKETIVLVDLVSDLLVISFGMIMETLTCEKVANE